MLFMSVVERVMQSFQVYIYPGLALVFFYILNLPRCAGV